MTGNPEGGGYIFPDKDVQLVFARADKLAFERMMDDAAAGDPAALIALDDALAAAWHEVMVEMVREKGLSTTRKQIKELMGFLTGIPDTSGGKMSEQTIRGLKITVKMKPENDYVLIVEKLDEEKYILVTEKGTVEVK